MDRLAFSILGLLLLIAWFIDYRNFRRDRDAARRERLHREQYWWNERENGPEGDH